jgi:hypothetical protein
MGMVGLFSQGKASFQERASIISLFYVLGKSNIIEKSLLQMRVFFFRTNVFHPDAASDCLRRLLQASCYCLYTLALWWDQRLELSR